MNIIPREISIDEQIPLFPFFYSTNKPKSTEKEYKKFNGVFYTPYELVNYINSQTIKKFLNRILKKIYSLIEDEEYEKAYNTVLQIKKIKVLDPSCGGGNFLLNAYKIFAYFYKVYNSLFNNLPADVKRKYMIYNIEETILLNNIYGIDIDEYGINTTNQNFNHIIKIPSLFPLKNIKEIDALLLSDKNIFYATFPEVVDDKFDFIIGNPPYVVLDHSRKLKYYKYYSDIYSNNTNMASLFIKLSLDLLKPKGIMAFLLPKSLIRVYSYKNIRDYILANAKIVKITDCGMQFPEVRGEQIILFLKKIIPRNNYLIPIDELKKVKNNKISIRKHFIKKEIFFNSVSWPILLNQEYQDLYKKLLSNSIPLGNLCDIFRGISILRANEILKKKKDSDTDIKIIKGDSIGRYFVKYFLWADKNIILKYNGKIEKLASPKVIIQNLFSKESGIIGTYDKEGVITLDTVTNLLLKKNANINLKYIIALLNSKLIYSYLLQVVYSQSSLTMHTDKIYLKDIPVKIPEDKIITEISNIVDKLLINKIGTEKFKSLNRQIDEIIYQIYDLTLHEIDIIEKTIYKSSY